VAGVLEVKVDFSRRPIQQSFTLRQVKVFNSGQLHEWLVITATTTAISIACFLLALPAAIQVGLSTNAVSSYYQLAMYVFFFGICYLDIYTC
jgi:hypothetical protein